ncbi:MAG: hypothetical protein CENE_00520 [Candidatus Celerinatantimonas neptuna]|nr:MAG: hypothetical protein CENE_00520 [Candidatus Celerinatantimonas neptuna]
MKIALIHSHLNNRGGSQRYVIEIANNLKMLGIDVDIFCYEYNKDLCYPELTSKLNIKKIYSRTDNLSKENKVRKKFFLKEYAKSIYKHKIVKRLVNSLGIDYLLSLYSTNKSAKKVANLIIENNTKYDLIFTHEEPLSVYAAIKYKKTKNIPIYWFCYDSIEKWFLEWKSEHHRSFLRRFILKDIYFRYDRYLVNKFIDKSAVLDNNMSKRYLRLYGQTPLIRRGGIPQDVISYNRKNIIREKFNLPDDVVVIFLLTRFVNYRRVHDILDVYMRLNANVQDRVFIYINSPITDDQYYQWCIRNYKEVLKNKNIELDLKFPENDREMYDMYLSSDIFIFPNDNQTWGHAPLEAMGCGVAALVSTGCGISEVVRNISPGTVFEVGNILQLTDIVENMVIDESYKIISRNQKEYVRNNLTWEIICKKYICDFNEILGNKHV